MSDSEETQTPISPKVVAAQTWAFLAPVLVAAGVALVSYLMTDDGRSLFKALPIYVQIPLFAAIAAIGARIAGYQRAEALRDIGQHAIDRGQKELDNLVDGYELDSEEDHELEDQEEVLGL